MFLGESHRSVKADNREIARHMQNGLNDGFAYLRLRIIQLRGVIPWEGGAIVAMIDITDVTTEMVPALKHNSRIGFVVIMVFKIDTHTNIIGKIFRFK